jgi:hypothetical protein
MMRMKALGVNWNSLDPFPRYGPTDFPVIMPIVPPTIATPPAYTFPVITEPAPVVTQATPSPIVPSAWIYVGLATLAGIALTSLLLKKS